MKKYYIIIAVIFIWSSFSVSAELSSTSYYITSDVVTSIGKTNKSASYYLMNNSETFVSTNKSTSYYSLEGFLNTINNESNQLRIELSINPDTILANNSSQAEVKATIYDKYNNVATYATYPIYFTNFNNTNNRYGYFVGSTSVTPVNGVATIYFHSSSNVSTNVVIYTYNPNTKYLPDTKKIYIKHGSAKKVLLTSSKTNYKIGESISNILFTVKIVDKYNNLVDTGSYIVSLTNSGAGYFVGSRTLTITNGIGVIEFVPGTVKGNDVVIASSSGLESGSITLVCSGGSVSKLELISNKSNLVLNNGSSILIRGLLTDDFGNVDIEATNTILFRGRVGNKTIFTEYSKATNGEAIINYSENNYGGYIEIRGENKSIGTNTLFVYVDIDGDIGGKIYNNYDINHTIDIYPGSITGDVRIVFEIESNIDLSGSEIRGSILNGVGYKVSGYKVDNGIVVNGLNIGDFTIKPKYNVSYVGITNYNGEMLWFYDTLSKGGVPVKSTVNKLTSEIEYSMEKFGIYFLAKSEVENISKVYNLYPNPFNPLNEKLKILFNIKEEDTIRIDVYDTSGAHIKTLMDNENCADGVNNVVWDGRDENGELVGSGIYIIYVSGEKIGSYSKTVSVLKTTE